MINHSYIHTFIANSYIQNCIYVYMVKRSKLSKR